MLPKSDIEVDKGFILPPKIKKSNKNFELLTETSSYKVFNAEVCDSHEKHTIRILDRSKEFVNKKFDLTATLFVKELLHLQHRYPGTVLTSTFEISENGQQMACATLPYIPLSHHIDEKQELFDPTYPETIKKLISDALFDIEFLWKNMQVKKITDVLGPESLCFIKEKRSFFLSDWGKLFKIGTESLSMSIDSSNTSLREEKLTLQQLKGELEALALSTLKLNKMESKEIESSKDLNPGFYHALLKSAVKKNFFKSLDLQFLLNRLLSSDPQRLPNLEDLWIKEYGAYYKPVSEEEKKLEWQQDSLLQKSIKTIGDTSPTLLAWSSWRTNKINIIDLETKQNYATFDGAMISNTEVSWTFLKEIPNTKLLVSLHHNERTAANMEMFDISKKGKATKIYSLGEVSGVTGSGDVTYNARRNILGAIPITESVAYHLFTINTSSKIDEIVKLSPKSEMGI